MDCSGIRENIVEIFDKKKYVRGKVKCKLKLFIFIF